MRLAILFLVLGFSLSSWLSSATGTAVFKAFILDAGDGTAILAEDPSGHSALFLRATEWDRVPERLRALGVPRILLLIAPVVTSEAAPTLKRVLTEMEPKIFVTPPLPYPVPQDAYALNDLRNTALTRQKSGLTQYTPASSRSYALGSTVVSVFPLAYPGRPPSKSMLAILVQYRNFSLLAISEFWSELEPQLLSALPSDASHVDVLCVTIRGGQRPSLQFLETIHPSLIVATSSGSPRSASPSYGLLSRAQDLGIPVARTDRLGSLFLTSDGNLFHLNDAYGELPANYPFRNTTRLVP
ncbi:MAG: hypothetical protein V2G42_01575 [bacterium JZ-2024 1]